MDSLRVQRSDLEDLCDLVREKDAIMKDQIKPLNERINRLKERVTLHMLEHEHDRFYIASRQFWIELKREADMPPPKEVTHQQFLLLFDGDQEQATAAQAMFKQTEAAMKDELFRTNPKFSLKMESNPDKAQDLQRKTAERSTFDEVSQAYAQGMKANLLSGDPDAGNKRKKGAGAGGGGKKAKK